MTVEVEMLVLGQSWFPRTSRAATLKINVDTACRELLRCCCTIRQLDRQRQGLGGPDDDVQACLEPPTLHS